MLNLYTQTFVWEENFGDKTKYFGQLKYLHPDTCKGWSINEESIVSC